MPELPHWVRLADAELDLILTFDPEDVADAQAEPQRLISEYRKWSEAVKSSVENGLETW